MSMTSFDIFLRYNSLLDIYVNDGVYCRRERIISSWFVERTVRMYREIKKGEP